MKKLVIATMVGLMALTTVALPVYAEEQVDTTTEATIEHGAGDQSTGGQSTSGESTGKQRKSKRSRKPEVAEPEGAIGKDAAKEKALTDAGLTSDQTGKVRSRVAALEDGTVIYKVKFTYDNQKYTYQINATTGEILDKSTKAVTESDSTQKTRPRRGHKGSRKSTAAETASAAGSDASQDAATTDSAAQDTAAIDSATTGPTIE